MTEERKLRPEDGWDAIEEMVVKEEGERVEALTDEELDRELAREGKDPEALRAKGQALAARLMAKPPAPVAALPAASGARSGRRWVLGLMAAALAAVALGLVAENRVSIARWFWPGDEIRADDGGLPEPTQVAARGRAAKLRDEAESACEARLWLACERKLDDAASLDPAGEGAARVESMRREIERVMRTDAGPGPDRKR